jgi:hypothetical protein
MEQLVKQQNQEIRGKNYIRQPSQPKVLYKEFSRPIRAANHLENRLMLERIAKAAHFSKRNQFKYDRELDVLHQLEKTLIIKSIDFDGEEFHRNHEKRRHFPFISVPTVEDVLDQIPSNCVLEFGPGNQIINKKPKSRRQDFVEQRGTDRKHVHHMTRHGRQKNEVQSKYAKYFRSQSACHRSTKNKSVNQRRPNTSGVHTTRDPEAAREFFTRSQSRLTINATSANRPMSELSRARQSDITEPDYVTNNCDLLNEDEHKSKSYRTLKEMFTYQEDNEPPIPDKKIEALKRMKAKEKNVFQHLDNRVKAFSKKLCKTKYSF